MTLTFGAVSALKFDSAALERLKQTHQNVTVADATIPAQAGFVLSVGKIDDNYLYRDLVDSIWEQRKLPDGVTFSQMKGTRRLQ